MKRFWILTDAEGTPLSDPVERLFVFNDKGEDDEHFYHAQSLFLLNRQGMDAHLNEIALVDRDKLSDLLAAYKQLLYIYGNKPSVNFDNLLYFKNALAAFEGREGK